ncbi:MAG: signal peptidase I [Bdellovibrionaceae bacterium]|nr:signal peptidase I [Pseudobdellovibrionaceae bacterium]MBX3035013.1 signal peptidase I [Pseudobdellovibrionaceae bacterium]
MAWRQYLLTVGVAVLAALLVRHFVLTAYKVPTGSMQPALKPGDFIFSLRTAYGLKVPFGSRRIFESQPERGDLVVFTYPHQPDVNYIKRVIALPGDRVQIRNNRLILNGEPLRYEPLEGAPGENPNPGFFEMFRESGAGGKPWRVILEKGAQDRDFGPLVVPSGEIFLLGDNRDTSDDSRYWGTVPVSQIQGKAVLIWLSLDWQNKWADNRFPRVRWRRVFSAVH